MPLLQCRRSCQYFCSTPTVFFSHVVKAESVQIHATSDGDSRTPARNWHLSQSEALISCSHEFHAPVTTHAPMTLMLQGQPELMTRLWRSHHDLKATCRGLSYRSAQKGLDSIKFFFERVSRNYIIVLLNFYYCLILVEILIFFLINIYHPVLRAIYRTS